VNLHLVLCSQQPWDDHCYLLGLKTLLFICAFSGQLYVLSFFACTEVDLHMRQSFFTDDLYLDVWNRKKRWSNCRKIVRHIWFCDVLHKGRQGELLDYNAWRQFTQFSLNQAQQRYVRYTMQKKTNYNIYTQTKCSQYYMPWKTGSYLFYIASAPAADLLLSVSLSGNQWVTAASAKHSWRTIGRTQTRVNAVKTPYWPKQNRDAIVREWVSE